MVVDVAGQSAACAAGQSHDPLKGETEWRKQIALIRDIFGNPYRSFLVEDSWLTLNVIGLAQAIYENRSFALLSALGAALSDAGCTNADILGHLRDPDGHCRGRWVLDVILSKS